MKKMVDVSVVVPAKNRAHLIGECLDSVWGQSHAPKEVIVVDDGSTDDTATIAERHTGGRVIVIRLEHSRGAQHARNVGVRNARCEWIAFQDSDDVWQSDKLKLQVDAVRNSDGRGAIVVYGDYSTLDSVSGRADRVRIPTPQGRIFGELLKAPGPTYQSMLVPRAAIVGIGYLDEQVPAYQEWDTALQLSRHCDFVHVPENLFYWRQHAGDTISGSKVADVVGYQYVVDKYRAEMSPSQYRTHLMANLLRALRWGHPEVALKILERNPVPGLPFRIVERMATTHFCPPFPVRGACKALLKVLG